MPFRSYAQNREDVVLRRVFRDVESGTYVDVGAAWPDMDSVTLAFYDAGWSGVNVEPNATLFEQLVSTRQRDINLQVLVGLESEEGEYFEISDHEGKPTGLSTTDASIAAEWAARGFSVEQGGLPTMSLSAVLREAGLPAGRFEFLKVDVEGRELDVLESGDWSRWRPQVVVCEAVDPLSPTLESSRALTAFMRRNDYTMRLFDGLNLFFEDTTNPTGGNWAPANIFDEYVASSDAALTNLAHLVGELELQVKGATAEITYTKDHLSWAQLRIAELERRIRELEVELDVARTTLDGSLARLDESNSQLAGILNSRAWRMTGPLRRLSKMLG